MSSHSINCLMRQFLSYRTQIVAMPLVTQIEYNKNINLSVETDFCYVVYSYICVLTFAA